MTNLTMASVGQRLDRARWRPLHTTILLALGAGWLFDSFEVQIFSSAIGPLGDHFHASVFARDAVLAVWLGGILIGALAGGRLADRFGRRRLFVLTLIGYAGFTVLTGVSPNLGFVYGFRFLAALGVGAEYAIINAAIAEFMPARVRGKANAVVMNFWPAGAVLAGVLAYLTLDTLALSSAVSWRYMFALGGLVALIVLVFRRRLPESPAGWSRADDWPKPKTSCKPSKPGTRTWQSRMATTRRRAGYRPCWIWCATTPAAWRWVRCWIWPRRSATTASSPCSRSSSCRRSTSPKPTSRSSTSSETSERWSAGW